MVTTGLLLKYLDLFEIVLFASAGFASDGPILVVAVLLGLQM